jgi:hypothetical protein
MDHRCCGQRSNAPRPAEGFVSTNPTRLKLRNTYMVGNVSNWSLLSTIVVSGSDIVRVVEVVDLNVSVVCL